MTNLAKYVKIVLQIFLKEGLRFMIFKVDDNKALLRLIVRAVEKGVGEDVREYLNSNNKATNNAVRLMRADNINTNLRDSVASNTVELKCFNRYGWTGCLLIDREHQVTYTICSKQTLDSIPKKKDRRIPHYLQTILHIQNAEIESVYQQMTLGEWFAGVGTDFPEEEYRHDYEGIMDDDLTFSDKYTHLVIVYEASKLLVSSIAVKLLTPDFQTAQEYSLVNLLKPDFSELTTVENTPEAKKDSHTLVSVKSGLKKPNAEMDTTTSIITVKNMEGKKQA